MTIKGAHIQVSRGGRGKGALIQVSRGGRGKGAHIQVSRGGRGKGMHDHGGPSALAWRRDWGTLIKGA